MKFRLPGGKLKPGEDEVSGLIRKLRNKVIRSICGCNDQLSSADESWDIGEVVARWWRPHFAPEEVSFSLII